MERRENARLAAWVLAAMAWMAPTAAGAGGRQLTLDPSMAHIGYTVFAFGLLPISATFDRFQGTIEQDPAHPADCRLDVTIDVASVRMADAERRREVLAPDMLDAAQFPTMHFAGACGARAIAGALTLHGVTRPFTLSLQRNGNVVQCAGTLSRRDFGILGMGGLVGPNVRIRLNVRLPV